MLNALLRHRTLVVLFVLALIIKFVALKPAWVESLYSTGIYPVISKLLRFVLGWIPFSIGDILYVAAGAWFVWKAVKYFSLLVKRKIREYLTWILLVKLIKLVLWIYIVFNLFWGLNYDREGIAGQLHLVKQPYDTVIVKKLAMKLSLQLNAVAGRVDSVDRLRFNKNTALFAQARQDYKEAATRFPFINYSPASIKPSLYGTMGKYFGYTGYYNPFTGEGQLKTSIPVFIKPFVINHEIAHQLGYAKENEASFVSYLVCTSSKEPSVQYSAYFEMFDYAMAELRFVRDTAFTKTIITSLHPRVKQDIRELRAYRINTDNVVAPVMGEAYERYLKLNNQPEGHRSYNEVIGWLVAYLKNEL